MKIKRKVQKTLPQLIEWAIDNNIKHRVFESNPNFDGVTYELGFDIDGDLYLEEYLTPTSLFTVEVEEELTEDTIFKELICLDVDGEYESHDNSCILDFDEDRVRAIHIMNDDLTLTLIWKEGRLID